MLEAHIAGSRVGRPLAIEEIKERVSSGIAPCLEAMAMHCRGRA